MSIKKYLLGSVILGLASIGPITANATSAAITTQVVDWVSANSADVLTIDGLGAYFSLHLTVDPSSQSSVTLTCGPNGPLVIPPGSAVVCFVDDGFTASWSSSSGANPAAGNYQIVTP